VNNLSYFAAWRHTNHIPHIPYSSDAAPKNDLEPVKLQDTPTRMQHVIGAPTGAFFGLSIRGTVVPSGAMLETGFPKSSTIPTVALPEVVAAQIIPRSYWIFGAIAFTFLLGGIGISSVVVAGSGLALFATIGAAIWEICRK